MKTEMETSFRHSKARLAQALIKSKEKRSYEKRKSSKDDNDLLWNPIKAELVDWYQGLQPPSNFQTSTDTDDWTKRLLKHVPTDWEMLKACIAVSIVSVDPQCAFDVAGDVLCFIKLHQSQTPPRSMTAEIYRQMKLKPLKATAVERKEAIADEGDIYEDDLSDSALAEVELDLMTTPKRAEVVKHPESPEDKLSRLAPIPFNLTPKVTVAGTKEKDQPMIFKAGADPASVAEKTKSPPRRGAVRRSPRLPRYTEVPTKPKAGALAAQQPPNKGQLGASANDANFTPRRVKQSKMQSYFHVKKSTGTGPSDVYAEQKATMGHQEFEEEGDEVFYEAVSEVSDLTLDQQLDSHSAYY